MFISLLNKTFDDFTNFTFNLNAFGYFECRTLPLFARACVCVEMLLMYFAMIRETFYINNNNIRVKRANIEKTERTKAKKN